MRPVGRIEQLAISPDRLERRLRELHVAALERLAGVVHVLHVLARPPLEQRTFRRAHHVFGIEPLHEEWNPGEAALDPDHLELGEAFGQPVEHPIRHVDHVEMRER